MLAALTILISVVLGIAIGIVSAVPGEGKTTTTVGLTDADRIEVAAGR